MPDEAPIPLGGVIPVLRVSNVAASRDYYVQALGFKVRCVCRFRHPGIYERVA